MSAPLFSHCIYCKFSTVRWSKSSGLWRVAC